MDIRKVKKLIELLEESDVAEIEIHEGEESVRISRQSAAAVAAPMAYPMMAPAPAAAAEQPTTPQKLTSEQQREIQVAWNEFIEPLQDKGSNGVGLGRDATVDGTGMLLANPHQGWEGISRFYAFHQMLPGELNMLGATVVGRAQVEFGTTEHVAWTSTVSTASRASFQGRRRCLCRECARANDEE